jgi:catechol 2,3-dioxygenase-like lactoylglutathione lyase family enzyme
MRRPRMILRTAVLAVGLIASATTPEAHDARPPFDIASRVESAAGATTSTADAPRARVSAVDTVGMTVADLDRSIAFYTTVLPFVVETDVEVAGRPWEILQGVFGARLRVVTLRLGDERIELSQYLAPRGRPMPPDSRGNDRWFQHVAIIVTDMDAAYARLREHGVAHASTGPQRLPDWNPGAAGIEAFYFRDPDGHFLEVLEFPPGKGQARWRQPVQPGQVFLGIDHTAIVVGNTEAALAFYRDTLGLEVVGTGVNHGVEQEHLNGVFGVRLRLTTLRAADGPAIELLEYLAPRDGRPTPADLKANDVAHWQITMRASQLETLLTPSPAFALVSPDVADVGRGPARFTRGVLVRDADGHATRLVN